MRGSTICIFVCMFFISEIDKYIIFQDTKKKYPSSRSEELICLASTWLTPSTMVLPSLSLPAKSHLKGEKIVEFHSWCPIKQGTS